jgi:hypothetical protein
MRIDQVMYALAYLSRTHEYLLRLGVKVASMWCTCIRYIGGSLSLDVYKYDRRYTMSNDQQRCYKGGVYLKD